MKILLVEDDIGLSSLLCRLLEESGYTVCAYTNGTDALARILAEPFDLIVADVRLPGMDGLTLCRHIRAKESMVPILLLTACAGVEDRVAGLDAGADDYLVKPFQTAELLARIRALLRRRTITSAVLLTVGDLNLDTTTREARRGKRVIRLSKTEYALLEYLMRHAGAVLTRSAILNHVWQYDFGGADNILDLYIGYLRNKIDKGTGNPLIHTVRGIGFMIEVREKA